MPQPREQRSIDDDAVASIRECYAQGQYETAIEKARVLLEQACDHAELLNIVGACHLKLGNFDASEACLKQAEQAAPQSADVDNNLGVLHQMTGRRGDAERSFRRAISKAPGHGEAPLNLGMLLRSQHRLKEAEHVVRSAIAHAPGNHEALNALGLVLKDLGRYDEADAAYRHALALRPQNAAYRLNLAVLLLHQGNWIEGLPLFEARYESGLENVFSSPPPVSFPQWRGERLEGASLLLWPEQGHGDQIQLVRYVRKIKDLGAKRVTLVCSAATRSLFATLPEADAVIAREAFDPSTCPPHDFWTYFWSIPFSLRETPVSIPANLPYLRAPRNAASKWERLMPRGRMRVGLVWKGNPNNANDVARSLPSLKTLERLWQVEGITFVSLQKEASGADLQREMGDRFIVNLGNRVADFSGVAAIVSRLDLVIGVDTAAIHLSAALGKPTWILLSNVGTDWRWTSAGSTSAWYPGVVTLFRQDAEETDWSGVVARVAHALSLIPTLVK
ncbi:tetratricopeptide repeat protein [Paraburkholderia acidicola]|uniref:Tetratricopeptide repeat protein n=1 Tax=Paraburkholderia acidicola TaxID=1912599 RepID=A0ABV1LY41_9BURK